MLFHSGCVWTRARIFSQTLAKGSCVGRGQFTISSRLTDPSPWSACAGPSSDTGSGSDGQASREKRSRGNTNSPVPSAAVVWVPREPRVPQDIKLLTRVASGSICSVRAAWSPRGPLRPAVAAPASGRRHTPDAPARPWVLWPGA